MYDQLEIFNLAQGLAKHAAARQAKIAGNVANADTPGYRAQDIAPFAETYQANTDSGSLRATRAGHMMSNEIDPSEIRVIDRPGPSAPNGNTVSLETEIMNATEVKHSHDLALTVYQTSLGILRTSIGRG